MFKLFRTRKEPASKPSSSPNLTLAETNKVNDCQLNRETEYFLNIFPELVWYRIIDQLHDSSSLQSLFNCSPFFRQLLLHKRVHFLFQDVFQVVIPQILGRHCCFSTNMDHRWKNEIQVKSLIFKCRLVCKSWNKAITNLSIQINPDWNFGTENPKKYSVFHIISKCYEFSSMYKFDKFMEKFSDCQGSPVLGGSVLIKAPPTETPDIIPPELFYKILLLFQNFGDYIYNCGFLLQRNFDNFSQQEVYLKLIEILWYVPNLRNLMIQGQKITNQEFNLWKSPPHFTNLQSLTLYYVNPQVCNLIVQENTHITSLVVHQSSKFIDFGQMMENQHTLEASSGEIRPLQNRSSSNWPLKTLHLIYTRVIDGSLRWSELFGILSVNFGESLEELQLSLPEEFSDDEINKIGKDSLRCRLNLPKLRSLVLTVRNETSFDFLLGMTESLENLYISKSVSKTEWKKTAKHIFGRKSAHTIHILGYHGNKLLQSFIWILFLKLKYVRLEGFEKLDYQYYRNGERKRLDGIS